jgi:ribosomal protein S18 acetylase RimI-like enzyme
VSLSFVQITAADADVLAALFSRIRSDPASRGFHPHPFTDEEAKARAAYRGRDCYVLMFCNMDVIGYGLLRGWDEGYEIPSLGIYVVDEHRGSNAAKSLMEHLLHVAKVRGASRVRLRVHPDNARALAFYRKLGWRFLPDMEAGQLVALHEAALKQ